MLNFMGLLARFEEIPLLWPRASVQDFRDRSPVRT